MRVRPYDGAAPQTERPQLNFTPFRTVPLGPRAELRIDIAERDGRRSVSARMFKAAGRGRDLKPDHPWHLFPEYLPDLIAALTEAAAEIGAPHP